MTESNHSADDRSSAIRFILDGEVHTVRGIDPNTTVLSYLREHLRRTGTKEGCAEGDCGACTVVVGEVDGDRMKFRAINSCIKFLPTLDGKELFTVESLRAPDGALHPVQRAMVDCHGSQCGFCTPGFIMTMFELYKSRERMGRGELQDALAGNLCRCTGYRPILDAAQEMYGDGQGGNGQTGDTAWLHRPFSPQADAEAGDEERAMVERLRSIRRDGTLEVRGPDLAGGERRYFAPRTVDALAALVEEHPDARLLAGGTDVGLWATKFHWDLDTLIYTGEVEELKRFEVADSHIEIGAAVTVTDAYAAIGERFPDMGEMYRRFASPPIRNAATIGGNVANGSPIGDSMPGLIALGSSVVLRKGGETRELPLDEFYLSYQKTALEPGELLERIRVPLEPDDRQFRMYKITKRFDQDISAVCAAFSMRLDGGRARQVRICFGGMAAIPQRAVNCERELEGKEWNESTIVAGMAALDGDYTPIDDMRSSAAYRALVTRNLLRKFYLETSGYEGETRVLEHGR
jgi:xanthine dehydrogenase small subunit